MKVLIVSDTHGKNHCLIDTINRVGSIDLLIHLGDFENGEDYIRTMAPCPVEFVSGNNDFFNGLPKDKLIQIGKYRVLMTHGHRYGVNFSTAVIIEAAKKQQADIVMFGHTHVPLIDMTGSVWAVNPGSLAFPRQSGRVPTFMIMELDSEGEAHFTLNYL